MDSLLVDIVVAGLTLWLLLRFPWPKVLLSLIVVLLVGAAFVPFPIYFLLAAPIFPIVIVTLALFILVARLIEQALKKDVLVITVLGGLFSLPVALGVGLIIPISYNSLPQLIGLRSGVGIVSVVGGWLIGYAVATTIRYPRVLRLAAAALFILGALGLTLLAAWSWAHPSSYSLF